MEQQISKEMTISDILAKYPQAADIMQSYGLHCFGCHANVYDSLEGGVIGHGMPEETLNALLQELNAFAAQKSKQDAEPELSGHSRAIETLTITQAAATQINELLQAQRKSGQGIRIEVLHGGCAGYMYNMDFDEKENENDVVIEDKGVRLFVDKKSMDMLKGTEIDYVETLNEAGFKINNPNAKSTCGCGKSYS